MRPALCDRLVAPQMALPTRRQVGTPPDFRSMSLLFESPCEALRIEHIALPPFVFETSEWLDGRALRLTEYMPVGHGWLPMLVMGLDTAVNSIRVVADVRPIVRATRDENAPRPIFPRAGDCSRLPTWRRSPMR